MSSSSTLIDTVVEALTYLVTHKKDLKPITVDQLFPDQLSYKLKLSNILATESKMDRQALLKQFDGIEKVHLDEKIINENYYFDNNTELYYLKEEDIRKNPVCIWEITETCFGYFDYPKAQELTKENLLKNMFYAITLTEQELEAVYLFLKNV
jgi:hypothetical protein